MAKDSFDAELWNDRFSEAPTVFVYQMGKVASTSIFRSLQNSKYSGAVLHAHSFDRYHDSPEVRCFYKYHSEHLPTIKLVSLVREPVSRNISAFFQNFRRDTGKRIENCELNFRELKQLFLKNYPHEIPLIWFDNNIKRNFAIDVYDYPFPACGHQNIRHGNADLLLMRHDLDDQHKEALIGKHIGDTQFVLTNENVGSAKQYAEYYDAFRRLKLPLEHLYYLASSKYMHHFFEADIGTILKTWTDRPMP